jgi:GNAT superfamily N-acetyltransferase
LENLKPNWDLDKSKIIDYFERENQNSKTFIVEDENNKIIWAIKIIIEYKLIRWWVKAWRIEDFAIKSGYQWLWLWKRLIEKAMKYAESEKVYKITLSCKEKLLPFYEKFWFEKYSINMKKYY